MLDTFAGSWRRRSTRRNLGRDETLHWPFSITYSGDVVVPWPEQGGIRQGFSESGG